MVLSEDDIDDLLYFARAGEDADLAESLKTLSTREGLPTSEILSAVQHNKSTCLHMGTGNGHSGITKYLVAQFAEAGQDKKKTFINAQNEFGNTALHWAALGGHLDIVTFLMSEGASPGLANDKNYVPLDLASQNDHMGVVDFFLSSSQHLEPANEDENNHGMKDMSVETNDIIDQSDQGEENGNTT